VEGERHLKKGSLPESYKHSNRDGEARRVGGGAEQQTRPDEQKGGKKCGCATPNGRSKREGRDEQNNWKSCRRGKRGQSKTNTGLLLAGREERHKTYGRVLSSYNTTDITMLKFKFFVVALFIAIAQAATVGWFFHPLSLHDNAG